jgi:thiosulfate reductase cytochrome b subunit
MLDFLNSLTPILVIGGLALFMTLETWMPYLKHGAARSRQRWHNLGMIAVATFWRFHRVLERFRDPSEQTIAELLKMPFRS